jgi:hypothetical protein
VAQWRQRCRHVICFHRHDEDIRLTESHRVGDHWAGDGEVGQAGDGNPMLPHVTRAVPTRNDYDVFTGTG